MSSPECGFPAKARGATRVAMVSVRRVVDVVRGARNPRPRHSKEWPADLFRRWRGLATGTVPGID